MLGDIRRFIVAVVQHWQGLLTGGIITAGVVLYVVVSGHNLARWIYLVLFLGIFFLMSCFLAWRDEHQRAELFHDRRRQQEKADEYAPLLHEGRKIMVTWVDPARPRSRESNADQRAAAFAWMEGVKAKLTEDFGSAVAEHFNLGKPPSVALGLSEPMEHEARVITLDHLIAQMRLGLLPLWVRQP
jgi:hypothetical protein